MKHAVCLVLFAGLLAAGCNGSHHSPTEPQSQHSAAPFISNLKAFGFTRYDTSTGTLPLSLQYADADGDVSKVLVTTPEGTAVNPTENTAGRNNGTLGFLQAVHLPDPTAKKLAFTIQVVDAAGNVSNTLSGEVDIPSL